MMEELDCEARFCPALTLPGNRFCIEHHAMLEQGTQFLLRDGKPIRKCARDGCDNWRKLNSSFCEIHEKVKNQQEKTAHGIISLLVLNALKSGPKRPSQIVEQTKANRNSVFSACRRLAKRGVILKVGRGIYALPDWKNQKKNTTTSSGRKEEYY
jgi:predicted Rossmann fold nucleotide-binding protein DprA/Smf involved in DNA uptake